MQWLRRSYIPEDVIGVSYDDARTLFLTELAGIFIGGSFEIGFWRDNGPDLDIGVFQVPAPPDSLAPASVVGWMDGSYGVNANSDNPEEATALVEWMGTPEFGQLFTENIKQLSPIPGTTPAGSAAGRVRRALRGVAGLVPAPRELPLRAAQRRRPAA